MLKLVVIIKIIGTTSSSLIYPPPIQDLHPQGLTSQMPVSQMPVGRATVFGPEHQTYTRAGLPECVVSTMSGPPPKTMQDRTQTKDTHPIPGQKLKFLTPPGIEPGMPGWKAGTLSTMPRRRITTSYNYLYYMHKIKIVATYTNENRITYFRAIQTFPFT